MRNKTLVIAIVFIVLILAAFIYYGAQSLSPRTYVAPGVGIVPETASTISLAPEISPAQPAISSPEQPPEAIAPSPDLRPATDAEAKAYAASSSPRTATIPTLPKNLLDVTVLQYGKNFAVIAERPSASVATSIWKFDNASKTISTLLDRKKGATYASSPIGKHLLLSYLDDTGALSLFFQTTATGERRPLRFSTLPAKCAVRDDAPIAYCGVPKSLPRDAVMPDDYFKKKLYTDDRIVMIDLSMIRVRELWSENSLKGTDVFMPIIMGKNLLFTNRLDSSVWVLPLSL